MVQELQKEEFFNLSTLAEVTLIAGKLSTTDINEIKNYISNKSDDMSQTNKQQHQHQQLNYESTKKKWKANWESSTTARLSCSSSISSDDDSTKSLLSYSHKVFDRKKQRSFKQSSTESEYDFHQFDHRHHFESMKSLSCDSSSCSNSDESCSLLHEKLQSSNEVGSSEEGMHAAASSTSGEEGSMNDHICPECGKKYSTSSNLARHRQTHRSLQDKKARRCPICDKVYVSMPAFSMHVRTHNQSCQCPHCGKSFSRPWLLQGHIRTHTGEKPFKCNFEGCAKAFADKSNLRAHIQTHSNTKPHTCEKCGKRFALKSYLYKHEESSCMKNRVEPRIRQKRSPKLKKQQSIVDAVLTEKSALLETCSAAEKATRSQQSAFVKEKIKEILEDGQKKTFITLKPRQELDMSASLLENRISVIRSVSSLLDEQKEQKYSIAFPAALTFGSSDQTTMQMTT